MSHSTAFALQRFGVRALSAAVSLSALAVVIWAVGCTEEEPPVGEIVPRTVNTGKEDLEQLTAERDKLDETVWSDEIRAQEYEEPFVRLWDSLRASTDKYQVFSELQFDSLILGKPGKRTALDHGIEVIEYDSTDRTLSLQQWKPWLEQLKQAGFQLIQSEWHHSRFDSKGDSPRSVVSMTLHVINKSQNERYIVKGDLQIQWSSDRDSAGKPVPMTIDATGLQVLHRKGKPFFDAAATLKIAGVRSVPTLIAHDLDGDGLSELILPAANAVYLNRGGVCLQSKTTLRQPALASRGDYHSTDCGTDRRWLRRLACRDGYRIVALCRRRRQPLREASTDYRVCAGQTGQHEGHHGRRH